jgi:hypothetical protein
MEDKEISANLSRILELTREMLQIADSDQQDEVDTDYAVLCGGLRDAAYQIRRMVDKARAELSADDAKKIPTGKKQL